MSQYRKNTNIRIYHKKQNRFSPLIKAMLVLGIFMVCIPIGIIVYSQTDTSYTNTGNIEIIQATPEWIGIDGEKEHEYVSCDTNCKVVGANGNYIELINNQSSMNPTYQELKAFLQKDITDRIPYNRSSFVCADYAEMLHNNAEAEGIRAAFVSVDFGPELVCHVVSIELYMAGCHGYCGGLHACNAFMTTDRGLIYIDDTSDKQGTGLDCTVNIEIGNEYIPEVIGSNPSNIEFCPMGMISSYDITW